ncbi:MAG: OmpH family outer membrane protein [Candidatus Cloacimonetes bacterium]|nr:OmpH family outer membrane protein [Candidatus Cloacimonadota bacterium]
MKRIITSLLVFVGVLSSFHAASLKVGIVDMGKVLFYFDEVKVLRITIANRESRYQAELNQQEAEIKQIQTKIGDPSIKEAEKERLEKQVSRDILSLQRKFDSYKKKLDEDKEQELDRLKKEIYKEINSLAKRKKFDFVFDKQSVHYGNTVDLTDSLIDRLNNGSSKKKNSRK